MTNKFDLNATPKTDRNKFYLSELEIIEGSEVPVVETWFAEELEQRARLAEEQCRRYKDIIHELATPIRLSGNDVLVLEIQSKMKEIEQVGNESVI
jgi:hypothetical protein